MIDGGDTAVGEELLEFGSVSFDDVGVGELLAQADAEIGVEFDDDHFGVRLDARQQLGRHGAGAGAEFDDALGFVVVDPGDDLA